MLTFEEWMHTQTPDGQTHEDEVRALYLDIERTFLADILPQVNRRQIFLLIARRIYDYSEMYTQYGSTSTDCRDIS